LLKHDSNQIVLICVLNDALNVTSNTRSVIVYVCVSDRLWFGKTIIMTMSILWLFVCQISSGWSCIDLISMMIYPSRIVCVNYCNQIDDCVFCYYSLDQMMELTIFEAFCYLPSWISKGLNKVLSLCC
jgi:hypothetical protein